MVYKDGEKMSKSLGNLVFVDQLRETWDPRAIRLAILEHHYRRQLGVGRGADAARRGPARPMAGRRRAGGPTARRLDEARAALDDDLDTPGALAAVDDAAARGEGVREAAALLGVDLGKRQPSDSQPTARGHPNHTRRQPGPRRIGRVTSASSDEHPGAERAAGPRRALGGAPGQAPVAPPPGGLRPAPRGRARPSSARTTSASSTPRS